MCLGAVQPRELHGNQMPFGLHKISDLSGKSALR